MKRFLRSSWFHWLNVPGAMLLALLQRTPVVRVAAELEATLASTPIASLLRSVFTLGASLGAVQAMAGATTLTVSSGSTTGITVATGSTVNVAFGMKGTDTQPLSWSISGPFPPGISFKTSLGTLTSAGSINVSSSGTDALVMTGTPTTAGTYALQLVGYEGQNRTLIASPSLSYTVTVTGSAATAPSITAQPANATVNAGASASFSVTASGTAPLTYQWAKGGSAISGATNSTYSIASAQAADAGSYAVTVTNSAGSATSNSATLTVNATATAPSITAQPANATVAAGASASFAVTASGTAPLTYQWSKGGAAISGATNATYSIASAQASDAGSYTVTVTNSAGSVTSSAATLTVNATVSAPTITTQPASTSASVGSSATFTVVATGAPTPTYQWRKDGVTLAGATAASLTVASVQTTDAGAYTVVVANSAGSVTSNAATLTVTSGTTGPAAWLTNISVRTNMTAGQDPLIVGLTVSGGAKEILVRGAGPSMASFIANTMADPKLDLYVAGGTSPILSNDDWSSSLTAKANSVGAFPFVTGGKDAGFSQTLSGGYTVLAPATGTGGVLLVEAYDLNPTSNAVRLTNISARNFVGTGDNVLIEGFALRGTGSKRLLIRAVAPSLANVLTNALQDPMFEVYSGTTIVDSNDNWDPSLTPTFDSVGAFHLSATKDAAKVVSLPASPGGTNYTVLVRGADGGTGQAIVEIYELP